MLKSAPAKRVLFEPIDPESTVRVLVAPFKRLWVAVPMAMTRKIIRLDEPTQQLQQGERFQVDNFSVQMCRLYEHIYDESNPQPETHGVVLHLSPSQILAVPMTQLPTIVNLSKSDLQPIPGDYRDLFMLEVASHITLMPQADTAVTVFLLDMDKMRDLVMEESA